MTPNEQIELDALKYRIDRLEQAIYTLFLDNPTLEIDFQVASKCENAVEHLINEVNDDMMEDENDTEQQ